MLKRLSISLVKIFPVLVSVLAIAWSVRQTNSHQGNTPVNYATVAGAVETTLTFDERRIQARKVLELASYHHTLKQSTVQTNEISEPNALAKANTTALAQLIDRQCAELRDAKLN